MTLPVKTPVENDAEYLQRLVAALETELTLANRRIGGLTRGMTQLESRVAALDARITALEEAP